MGIERLHRLSERLNIELEHKDRSGIFAATSKLLAYNSNKIEGSSLTPEHTNTLFSDGYIDKDGTFVAQEIEEMNGHFLMFQYLVQTLHEDLTEDIIKKLHYELKIGVFHDRANGYAVGTYKERPNRVGDMNTTLPQNVQKDMNQLLQWYHSQNITLHTLADFHIQYENIHPFQDGNGRTGRALLFREALKHNIVPPIILDSMQVIYLNCLKAKDVAGLAQLFVECQMVYEKELSYFLDY